MPNDRIVLAYSGGLDTTVAVPWLKEKYGADIVTLTIDLGMVDLGTVRQRALSIGAVEAVIVDGRQTLVDEFLFPSLQAGTVYEEQYPLATALGRPLIARYLVEAAREYGALCRGPRVHRQGQRPSAPRGGRDGARPEPEGHRAHPRLGHEPRRRNRVRAGAQPADKHPGQPLLHRRKSVGPAAWRAGELEDPWLEPPEDAYLWTKSPSDASDEPAYLEVAFERGIPTAIDGETDGRR